MKKTLSQIANELETDKGTADARKLSWGSRFPLHHCWHYTEIYEKYMSPLRDKLVKFLEIGICDTRFPFASPKMWKEYFENVDLYCVDNFWGKKFDPVSVKPLVDLGAHFILADQGSELEWEKIKSFAGSEFDFIVEDGSHEPDHMMYSLYQASSMLKPGGYYFMEDIDNPAGAIGIYGYDNSKLVGEIVHWMKTGNLKSEYLTDMLCDLIVDRFYPVELIADPSGKNYLGVFKAK